MPSIKFLCLVPFLLISKHLLCGGVYATEQDTHLESLLKDLTFSFSNHYCTIMFAY